MTVKQFEEYLKEGIVNKVKKDNERARSLIIESERKMSSLKEKLEKIGIKNENANDYVEYCYDMMMLLIRAKMLLEGYHASGQGAHESEVAYMRVLDFNESDIRFADQLRYFRNGILYYGSLLDKEYAEKVVEFTKKICAKLSEMLK